MKRKTISKLASFSSYVSPLEQLVREVLDHQETIIKAMMHTTLSKSAEETLQMFIAKKGPDSKEDISNDLAMKAGQELVRIFANYYKLQSIHEHFKADPKLQEREIIELMLIEILKAEQYKVVRILTEFDEFGEQALRSPQGPGVRTSTVQVHEECHLVSISYEDYWKIVYKIKRGKMERRIEFLKSISIFKGFHREKLKKLSRMFVQKTYGRNYVVFSQSQPANSFYIVCKGDFQVSIKTA